MKPAPLSIFSPVSTSKRRVKKAVAGDALKSEISAFTKAVLEGIPPVVSGEDGRRALEVAIEISRQLVSNSSPTPN
jgi:hypothetical protein